MTTASGSAATTTSDAKRRASEDAERKKRERIAELGAVQLTDLVAERPRVDYDSLLKCRKRGGFRMVFSGPPGTGRRLLVRVADLDRFDAELEQRRCAWPEEEGGCDEYALLSNSGRCKRHDAAVPRRGKVWSTEYAKSRGVDHPDLVARLEAGEFPGEPVDRSGRHVGWLIDEQVADAALEEHWHCRWHNGCDRYGLGATRHCSDHAGAFASTARAVGRVRVTCPGCGDVREEYRSQVRAGELCWHCNPREAAHQALRDARAELIRRKATEGLVPTRVIAEDYGIASTPAVACALAKRGVRCERQLGLVFVDRRDADSDRLKRLRNDRRARAALKFEVVAARLEARGVLTTRDQEKDLRARFEVKKRWKQRLGGRRPDVQTTARNQRCLERAEEIVGWDDWGDRVPPPTAVLRHVFVLDWEEHEETWPRGASEYPEDAKNPACPTKDAKARAVDMLRKAIGPEVDELIARRSATTQSRC
jgi:hypothetical protein